MHLVLSTNHGDRPDPEGTEHIIWHYGVFAQCDILPAAL